MDKQYKLKITPAAADDLKNIYNYIKYNLISNTAASNIIKEISTKLKSLTNFP